jgi:hypothetical protein
LQIISQSSGFSANRGRHQILPKGAAIPPGAAGRGFAHGVKFKPIWATFTYYASILGQKNNLSKKQ